MGGDGRHTSLDFAACPDHLANTLLPDAAKIVLIMDNLNTHKEASLYEAFPPANPSRMIGELGVAVGNRRHGSPVNI